MGGGIVYFFVFSCLLGNIHLTWRGGGGGGGGYGFFWRKNFLSVNLLEKKFLSLKWAGQNILFALCALQIIVFVEKK